MNLLITGAWSHAAEYLDEIKRSGHNIAFLQFENDEEIPCPYDWVEGIVCNGLFLYHPIEKFVHLKFIQLTSAGFDRVPMEYIQERGIEIHNAGGVYSIPMAEFAVGGVLKLYKQASFFYENQKKHRWDKHRGLLELYGKRVCIAGCGSVGTECAKRFRAFGCEVVGADRFTREDENYHKMTGIEQIDGILPETDILVLAMPLTGSTRHFMDERRFSLLKAGALLVNLARGALVDTQAMVPAMDRLGGAVLDVFEQEPLDGESPLWDMEHVIISPHNSFIGDNNGKRLDALIMGTLNKEERLM